MFCLSRLSSKALLKVVFKIITNLKKRHLFYKDKSLSYFRIPWVRPIEIIDIECGLLSHVSQKIVAIKWRIYKGKFFCQIEPLSRDRARILYLIILWRPQLNSDRFTQDMTSQTWRLKDCF